MRRLDFSHKAMAAPLPRRLRKPRSKRRLTYSLLLFVLSASLVAFWRFSQPTLVSFAVSFADLHTAAAYCALAFESHSAAVSAGASKATPSSQRMLHVRHGGNHLCGTTRRLAPPAPPQARQASRQRPAGRCWA